MEYLAMSKLSGDENGTSQYNQKTNELRVIERTIRSYLSIRKNTIRQAVWSIKMAGFLYQTERLMLLMPLTSFM
jgi:hypothetical protein